VLSGEVANSSFIVFGLTRLEFEPTTYRTRGVHWNHSPFDIMLVTIFIKSLITNGNVVLSLWSLNTGTNNIWLFSRKQWHQCHVFMITCVQQAIIYNWSIHSSCSITRQSDIHCLFIIFMCGQICLKFVYQYMMSEP
jgi:hypothetical protein